MFKDIEQMKGGEKLLYDYKKLRGKIVEKFATLQNFARAMEWSERTLSLKINNKRYWKQSEIIKACKILDINKEDIVAYFFTIKVQ